MVKNPFAHMGKKLVIMQCVKTKIWDKNTGVEEFVEAENAYVSPYFKKMKEYAENIERADKLLILSAKWGLINPNYKICDYNVTFNNKRTSPLTKNKIEEMVLNQRIDQGGNKISYKDFDKVIFLGGKLYVKMLGKPFDKLGIKLRTPFQDEGLKGIGYIQQWLKKQINHEK